MEPAQPARDGEVEIGERVTVLDLTTAAVRDLRVVEPADADGRDGKISRRSALGAALLGRRVGDVVEVPLRDAGRLRLEVVEIDG
jgi:transcription elongation factor GreA